MVSLNVRLMLHRAFQREKQILKGKKMKLFKITFATAARCQLGASKRKQRDTDLWRLNVTKHKQQPLEGSYLDLERTPAEGFGFCDGLSTAVGPCDQTCIILSRDFTDGSGFQRIRTAVFTKRNTINFKWTFCRTQPKPIFVLITTNDIVQCDVAMELRVLHM